MRFTLSHTLLLINLKTSIPPRLRIGGSGQRSTFILKQFREEWLGLFLPLPYLSGELLSDFLKPKSVCNRHHSAPGVRPSNEHGLSVFTEENRVWKDALAPLDVIGWRNHQLYQLQKRCCFLRASIKPDVSRPVDLVVLTFCDLKHTNSALAVEERTGLELSSLTSQRRGLSHLF